MRRRLRQDDVSDRSGVSRSEIGRAERGQADRLRLATLDLIATALGARLEVRLTWNGEALDRLLDAGHAALVEATVVRLTSAGWECAVELSFNIWGERGSVDVLAFHPVNRVLLVVEVKSVLPDVQATLMTLDRKARLAREVARQRDWDPVVVGRLLVIGESRTSRRRVEAHRAIFQTALPTRGVAARAWIGNPSAGVAFAGLMFLSSGRPTAARHRVRAGQDGVMRRPRSDDHSGILAGLSTGRPEDR
jgi:transcriptional regulator with XRE-family HTH domain